MTRGELHTAFMTTLPVYDSWDVVRSACFFLWEKDALILQELISLIINLLHVLVMLIHMFSLQTSVCRLSN